MKRISSLIICVLLFFSFFSFSNVSKAAEATLYLSPSSGSYILNKSVTIKIMVKSGGGIGINAAEGRIKYDPDYLVATNISDGSSIFKLWTTDPTYINSAGTITFGGGSPGAYQGDAGEIFNITFTAKKLGETEVTFSSGIVLAADGKGTNVFSGFGNGKYTIIEQKAEEKKTEEKKPAEEVKGVLPPLPEISSASHPKTDIWYSNNEPEFGWKIISDLTGVSYSVTDENASDPGPENDGIVENITLDPQEDGEWYFHIKYQNKFGWGQIAHRKFLIDVTPPEHFNITVDNEGDPTNPTPKLVFSTIDKTSGIKHYIVNITGEAQIVSPDDVSEGYFRTDPLSPSEYIATIAAVDFAENVSSSSVTFIIAPLKAPIITDLPKIINKNEELIIRGTSFYSRVKVKIYIGKPGEEAIEGVTTTDDEGNWSYFYRDGLDKGNYEVWAKIVDKRGAQSLDSTRHLITVVSPSLMCAYGWWIFVLMLLIIIGLILFILFKERQFVEEKSRIKKENDEVKTKLNKIFSALREEVDELIELADKKPGYSEPERRIKEKLQESLDISEEFIAKEVADVEKEIKLKKKRNEK